MLQELFKEDMLATPWELARLAVRADLATDFRDWTRSLGGEPPDILELLMTAATATLGDESRIAARMVEDFSAGEAVPWDAIEVPVSCEVVVARMGPILYEEGPAPDGGYPREHRGVSVASTPQQAWSAGRGYWKLAPPRPTHLVVTRLGRIMGVFRTDEWSTVDTGRRWASKGWLIEDGNLVSLDRRRKTPEITDDDLAVARAFDIPLLGYPVERRGGGVMRIGGRRRATW